MIECTQDGLKWLQFSHLSEIKKLKHGIFSRHGGVSQNHVGSLNFGILKKDSKENVLENRRRALKALEINELFSLHQCHSDKVFEAKKNLFNESALFQADAIVTSDPNLGLMIQHADCQAAIFYDPVLHVVANVHSGWRGSVKNIYQKTVSYMKSRYGTNPANLLVGISPSLSPAVAEFRNFLTELPVEFWSYQVKPTYFDFWQISQNQLMQCGVLYHHIEIAQICTYQNPQDWFSYRFNPLCGNNATIVELL